MSFVTDGLTALTKFKPFAVIIDFSITLLGKIHWRLPRHDRMTEEDKQFLRETLAKNYFVILTQNKNHFSAYLVSLGNFFLTGKFSFWSHALMNLEDEVQADSDFRLVEAVSDGVKFSSFDEVFKCNAVALLKPKSLSLAEWTGVLDTAALQYVGRKYDNLFDLADDNKLSCVELVRNILRGLPNYSENFKNFEALIAKRKNLTPTMFYECEDFEVVYEKRH